jgi:hypothetical protein
MWRAKLKRFETWDRVFVTLSVASFLYGIFHAVMYFAGGGAAKTGATPSTESSDGPGVLSIIFICWMLALTLFAQGYSLWAIWRHKRVGFIIQVVFVGLAAFVGAMAALGLPVSKTSAWSWIQTGIIAAYCGLRTYQLRPTPAPPPLPQS